jgi:hypothetical protein
VLDVALRRADGSTVVDPAYLTRRVVPPLPVLPALHPLLPEGLRRGSTVSVSGSVSLLLALLGAASAAGAWCAMVGEWSISAEAAAEYQIELSRLAIVPSADTQWSTAVGALLDAVDVVATRIPSRVTNGDIRRLMARAHKRDAVLMPFSSTADEWPGADVRLRSQDGAWAGIGLGYGRLRQRRLAVTASGRGSAARPRSALLWLPAAGGGVQAVQAVQDVQDVQNVPPEGTVVDLYRAKAG